ncbi:MAG: hypothetical protein ACRDL4_20205, partial [Thermoleophilaceae bacterium]
MAAGAAAVALLLLIVVVATGGGEDEPQTTPADLGVPEASESLGDRSEEADRAETEAEPDAGGTATPVAPSAPPASDGIAGETL